MNGGMGQCGFMMANNTGNAHSCSMKVTEVIRKCAAEQGIAEEEALKTGLEGESREFTENGREPCAKA